MKKILICLIVALLVLLSIMQVRAEEEEESTYTGPEISASSAILIDESTGTVIVQKDADTHLDPTGLTKIMSVYLACENLKDTDTVTMTSEVSETYDHSTSVIWVMEGEEISVLDLEYASLIQNANDTTAMLASKVSGSAESFVTKMNEKAQELGMSNTNFQNIFGLNNEENYSSARDIATLVRKAVKNSTFAKIFGASSWTIEPTNLQSNSRVITQGCEYLRSGDNYDSNVEGCKVGYTEEGGYALATKATKDGTSYIVVVLGEETEDKCYEDTTILLNYGFDNYHTVEITPSDIGTKEIEVYDGKKHIANVIFSVSNSFSALLPTSIQKEDLETEIVVSNESSPVTDDITAVVQFKVNDEIISTSEMTKTVTSVNESTSTETSTPSSSFARTCFDFFCIGVLAIIILIKISILLAPPKQ